MNDSLPQVLLGSTAFVVSVFINLQAFARLTPEQQQDVKAVQSKRVWILIPQLLISMFVVIDFMGKQTSFGRLLALIWAVPLLIFLAWEHRRLRAKPLPASYLKSHLIGESLFVGGTALLFWVV